MDGPILVRFWSGFHMAWPRLAQAADASLLNAKGWARTMTPFSRTERVRPFYASDPVDDRRAIAAEVASFRPNAWGLHDMHGNVAEWTRSAYLPYPYRPDDPRHADPAGRKTVRGGSWYDRSDLARSACRIGYWPWQRVFDVGFRVTCEAVASEKKDVALLSERGGPFTAGRTGGSKQ
jgi:formylglycine-generating enzyme required for sulfatase activity